MNIGDEYELVRHPYKPRGKITRMDTEGCEITWNDTNTAPSQDYFKFLCFVDGTFERVPYVSFGFEDKPCECGSKFTSFPDIHSDYCPKYTSYKY